MAKEKAKKANILDEVKELDKKVRKHLVYKNLRVMKKWARDVLETKEKTRMLLEELGVAKEDIKRLIDYVNSEVELTDEDRKDIRDKVKGIIEEEKKEIEDEISFTSVSTSVSTSASTSASDSISTSWADGTNTTNVSENSSGTIDFKVE